MKDATATKSTFTPGPWHIKTGQSGQGCLHVVSDDNRMHTGCISFDGNGRENARLIAASPELYEALKRMHDTGRCWCRYVPVDESKREPCAIAALLARIDGE